MSNDDFSKSGYDISSISSSIKFKYFNKVLSNNLAELRCKKCISICERSLNYDLIYSGLGPNSGLTFYGSKEIFSK